MQRWRVRWTCTRNAKVKWMNSNAKLREWGIVDTALTSKLPDLRKKKTFPEHATVVREPIWGVKGQEWHAKRVRRNSGCVLIAAHASQHALKKYRVENKNLKIIEKQDGGQGCQIISSSSTFQFFWGGVKKWDAFSQALCGKQVHRGAHAFLCSIYNSEIQFHL